jgi:hypothetical protein
MYSLRRGILEQKEGVLEQAPREKLGVRSDHCDLVPETVVQDMNTFLRLRST